MQLNHLDLQIADVPALAAFLIEHFGLEPLTAPDAPSLVVLGDGHGFVLVLQRLRPGDRLPAELHIGFFVASAEDVAAHHARLVAAGIAVSPIDRSARGTVCYCRGPGGLLIEIGSRAGTRFAAATR